MSDAPSFDPGFSTSEMTSIFSEESRVDAMVRFEAGLAQALVEVGVAPEGEAGAVMEACQKPIDDPGAILATTWERGTPVIALIEELGGRIDESARRWLHFGATTQDVMDTAQMLLGRRAMEVLESSLIEPARLMKGLMDTHRNQVEMGRTFLQHARPTTFGLRIASWLDVTLDHIVELRGTRAAFAVQLGGPVGNLADFGGRGLEVRDSLARILGLESTRLAWHADRSRMWIVSQAVERSINTAAKIATDVILLAQSEVGEISVRSGGSSSMAEKQNPLDAIRARAAAEVCRGAVGMMVGAPPHELDRAVGSWHTEWVAWPLVFQSAGAVWEAMRRCLESLTVHGEVMESRLTAAPPAELLDSVGAQIERVSAHFEQVVGSG